MVHFALCYPDEQNVCNYCLTRMASLTDRFSGAEVVSVCSEAAIIALTDDPHTQLLTQAHLEKAIATTNRQITPDMLQYYERIRGAAASATGF